MQRRFVPVTLALLVGLTAGASARADDLDKYLPANAGFYVHVNINRLLDADVIRKAIPMAFDKYGDQLADLLPLIKLMAPPEAAQNIPEAELKKAIQEMKKPQTIAAGFDAAKDTVTDIVVVGDPAHEDQVLILVKGPKEVTEDAVRGIAAIAGLTGQVKVKELKQAKATIFEIEVPMQPGQSAFVAVPEPGVVCFGVKKDLIEKALAGGRGGLSDQLKPLVAKRTPRDFVFFAMAGSRPDTDIKSGFGSLVLDKDISGNINATYGSADKARDAAKEMNDSLAGVAETIKGALGDKAKEVAPVLEKMKASANGMAVTGQFTIPGSVVEKLLAKEK